MFTKTQCYDDIKPMSCLNLNAKRNPIQPDSEVPVDSKSHCPHSNGSLSNSFRLSCILILSRSRSGNVAA